MKKHINDKVKSCFASFLILFVSATTVKAEGPKTGAFAEIPTLGDTLRASERMVDVAYGKQKYDAVTSSMSTVHADELRKSTATSIGEALIGRLPGLIVKKGSYEPGGDEPSIYIRGLNTYGGANTPLVIVDGFRTDYNQLSLYEIESISVLKDAAAVALYGQQAANGVLLVTTKRGFVGKTTIDVNVNVGWQEFANKPELLNAYEYAVLHNQARTNDGLPVLYDPITDLPNYGKGGVYQYTHPDNNYFDEIFKKSTLISNVGINIGGGTKAVRYMVTAGYMHNGGMFNHTDLNDYTTQVRMNRFNLRSNLDVNITKNLSAQIDMGGRVDSRRFPGSTTASILDATMRTPPQEYPLVNPDGSLGGTSRYTNNPLGLVAHKGYQTRLYRNLDMTLKLKYDFGETVKGLSVGIGGSAMNAMLLADDKLRNFAVFDITGAPDPVTGAGEYAYRQYNDDTDLAWQSSVSYQYQRLNFEAFAAYNRTFGDHSVDAMLMYHMDRYQQSGSYYKFNTAGFGLRAHYGFKDRYFAEFAASYYGEEQYMPGRRFGFFPAGALAWVISKENFLKDSKVVNYLKLRASYGKVGGSAFTGGSATDRIFYRQFYYNSGTYTFGVPGTTTSIGGTFEDILANPFITWDKSYKTDISIEGTFFNHVNLMFDYFHDVRKDILTQNTGSLPFTMGVENASWGNGGEVTNRGYEATLEVFGHAGDFEYSVQGGIWYNHNIINKRPDANLYDLNTQKYLSWIGKAVGQKWGLLCDGFYTAEDLDNMTAIPSYGSVQEGDARYVDVNNDGVIDSFDVVPMGYQDLPQYTYTFSLNLKYKNVYLYAMGQGTINSSIMLTNAADTFLPFWNNNNAFQYAKQSWTPETAATAVLPRLSTLNNPNNSQASTVWLRSNDYFKLRNLEIGYEFPQKWMKEIGFRGAKVYFRGQNLFTISREMDFIDPETFTGYPATRSYSIGLSLTF